MLIGGKRALVFLIACNTCPASPCPKRFDFIAACAMDGTCTVDANPLTTCAREPGEWGALGCEVRGLNAGSTLVLSIGPHRSALGTRDDFNIGYAHATDPAVSFSSVRLFFDDQPADCTCGGNGCACANVPPGVVKISLKATVGPLLPIIANFDDIECVQMIKPCPN